MTPRLQFLTFELDGNTYAVDIACVQEVRGLDGLTPAAGGPAEALGCVDVRGTAVPVIDLRARLGSSARGLEGLQAAVVLDGGPGLFAIAVNAIGDMLDLPESALEPIGRDGIVEVPELIHGVVRHGDVFVFQLELAGILTGLAGGGAPSGQLAKTS